MDTKTQQPTSVVRIVAYIDGALYSDEECTVPAHLAEQVAVSALVQAEDPDLDLAWENWNNAKEEEERNDRRAALVEAPPIEAKLERIAERLKAEGYRASVEYPCFLCVQMDAGGSLCMGFVNGPFGWDVQDAEFGTLADIGGESTLTEAATEDALYAYALATCIEVKATKGAT